MGSRLDEAGGLEGRAVLTKRPNAQRGQIRTADQDLHVAPGRGGWSCSSGHRQVNNGIRSFEEFGSTDSVRWERNGLRNPCVSVIVRLDGFR